MILMQRLVKVDGKVRTDTTYPAGFMDVIQLEKTNEHFRCEGRENAGPAPRSAGRGSSSSTSSSGAAATSVRAGRQQQGWAAQRQQAARSDAHCASSSSTMQ